MAQASKDCAVAVLRGRGDGLVALRAVESGHTLVSETAAMAMQHGYSRRLVSACAGCFAALDGLVSAVKRSGVQPDPALVERLQRLEQRGAPWSGCKTIVQCRAPCPAVFCSALCRDRANQKHHAALCPGVHGPAVWDAMRRLERHAEQTSEVLVLVAMTAVDVALQVSRGRNVDELKCRAARHLPVPWEEVVRYQWHLCANIEEFVQRRCDALDEFRLLLAEVVDLGVGHLLSSSQRDAVLERNWLGVLAGQCDLIDVFLEMPNPLNLALEQNESDDEVSEVTQ